MKSQYKIDTLFIDIAKRVAEESHCIRKKVGAILVQDNSRIISIGYNGTHSGEENKCEDENNVTKPGVIHAEDNVYRKLLRSPEFALNSTLYCTLQPCERCANLIIDAGTKRVVYAEQYRCNKGIDKLKRAGIMVEQYDEHGHTSVGNAFYYKGPYHEYK